MDLVAYLRVLRRRWTALAACVLLGIFVAVSSWMLRGDDENLYQATHVLAVPPGASINLTQAAQYLRLGDVPEEVARQVDSTPAAVAAQIRPRVREDVGFLEVTALGVDPARVTVLADLFAEELIVYLDEVTRQQQRTQLDQVEEQIAELRATLFTLSQPPPGEAPANDPVRTQQIEQATAQLAALENDRERLAGQIERTTTLQTFTEAEALPISGPEFRALFQADPNAPPDSGDPSAAINPRSPLGLPARLGFGVFGGIVLGMAVAFVLERVDPRLHTKEDLERVFGWPVLAEIPPLTKDQQVDHAILAHDAPRSRGAEAYRVLRSGVLFVAAERARTNPEPEATAVEAATGSDSPDREPTPPGSSDGAGHVVLVTSASPAEGKTTTAANLASVLGESGRRVLVINCDFRRPTLGSYMGIDDAPARVIETPYPNVALLAQVSENPDEANPAAVVNLQRQVIAEARRRFDWVVLDTAPVLTTNDANEILDTADFVLVVARAGRVTREAADRCGEALERRGAPVLGSVLIAASEAPAARYYYYGNYYLDDTVRTQTEQSEDALDDVHVANDSDTPEASDAESTSDEAGSDSPGGISDSENHLSLDDAHEDDPDDDATPAEDLTAPEEPDTSDDADSSTDPDPDIAPDGQVEHEPVADAPPAAGR